MAITVHRAALRSAAALLILIAGCTSKPKTAHVAPAHPFDREASLASFDELFTRIGDAYYDPARLEKLDWNGLRLRLRPKVEAATNIGEVRVAMTEALGALGETHFSVIPADVHDTMRGEELDDGADAPATQTADAGSGEDGTIGIHVRLADGVPIVGSVDAGSSADGAGVKPGWAIDRVDGKPFDDTIAQVRETLGDTPLTDVHVIRFVESRLVKPVGESVSVRFVSTRGKRNTLDLESQKQPGLWATFGHLPTMNLRFESRKLENEIGYFSLSIFLSPPQVMPAYSAFIRENQSSRGIVIDLRGNPGGLGAMATGMGGFLIAEEGKRLGTMIRRDGNLQFVVNPRYPQFKGPVAILVDTLSMSTSEILAGGLQDLHRARVFGQQTPGAALPSTIARLPNGDALQYALADYVSASGRRLEGEGITPDEAVPLRRAALEAGHDEVLEAACRWILEQAATAPTSQPN